MYIKNVSLVPISISNTPLLAPSDLLDEEETYTISQSMKQGDTLRKRSSSAIRLAPENPRPAIAAIAQTSSEMADPMLTLCIARLALIEAWPRLHGPRGVLRQP
eukprot:scaffold273386_cov28-Tisochrysis_lutea.AAC.2